MKLINKNNEIILSDKLKIANNPLSRMIGLLGKRKLNKGEGLYIIPCNSIHSFFMKFKFDVIFINKKNKIVYLIEDMPAWRASKICFSANSVIELPSGVIKETKTNIGDILEFKISI